MEVIEEFRAIKGYNRKKTKLKTITTRIKNLYRYVIKG